MLLLLNVTDASADGATVARNRTNQTVRGPEEGRTIRPQLPSPRDQRLPLRH